MKRGLQEKTKCIFSQIIQEAEELTADQVSAMEGAHQTRRSANTQRQWGAVDTGGASDKRQGVGT